MDIALAIIGVILMLLYLSISPLWHNRRACGKELLLGLLGLLFVIVAAGMNVFLPFRAMEITVKEFDSSKNFNYLQTNIAFAETIYVAEIAARKSFCWATEERLILMDTNSKRLLDRIEKTLAENQYLTNIKVGELKIESGIMKEK
jgi:hypothetical protein